MKHTRLIHLTTALAALTVGSACTATTTPDVALDDMRAGSTELPSPAPSTETVEVDEQPENFSVVVNTPMTTTPSTVAPPTTAAPEPAAPAPAPEPEPEPMPEPEPVPEPPADPDPDPPSEPEPDPGPDSDPGLVVSAVSDLRIEPLIPGPLPRPDLGLVFAPCGAFGPLPDTASAVSSVQVDAVGDGTADDTFVGYLDDGDWTLRLTTSSGTISEYAVTGVGAGFVEALGAVQLDGEVGDQFLAVVGSGASNLLIGAFGADEKGCIVRFASMGGTDIEFAVGGTVGQLNGFNCGVWMGSGYIEAFGATHMGDGLYNVYGTVYEKVGVDVLEANSGMHLFGVDYTEAEAAVQFDCGALTL